MKQFGKILKFELKSYLTNKIFVGVTIFLVAAIVIVMFFPRILEIFEQNGKQNDPNNMASSEQYEQGSDNDDLSADGRPVMMIVSNTPENSNAILEAFSSAFWDYSVKLSESDIEDIKEQIISGEIECAFLIDSMSSFTYYVDNLSMYDSNAMIADEVLRNLYQMSAMIEGGMSPENAMNILDTQVSHSTISLGKDQIQNFFYTYIMIFALYMVILLYGQMVATNVATEKSSRAMELLITSAKPTSMMFGKVLASCIAGLFQLIAVFGTALLCYSINQSYWAGNEIVASIFDMPLSLFLYMLIFFILGFLIYAFLYGAIGSTASKLEDINTSVMPITLLFIVGFFVVIFSMSSGEVDTLLMRICSYIPFTSPMAMFTRIAMSTVPFYEILISILILIGSVIGVGVLSAKIYRVGVLLYGTPPKPGAIIKAIRNA